MTIVRTNTPTEIRSLADTAGRGLRTERRQELELRQEANDRANQQLALQEFQVAQQSQLQQRQQAFNERVAIDQFEAQREASSFNRGIQSITEDRLERNLERQIQADRDRSELTRASLDQAQRLANQDKQFKAAIEKDRGIRDENLAIFNSQTALERVQLQQQGATERTRITGEDAISREDRQLENRIKELQFRSQEANKQIQQAADQSRQQNANILLTAQQAGIVPESMVPHLRAVGQSLPTNTFTKIISQSSEARNRLGDQADKAMQITSEEAIEGQIESVKTQLKLLDESGGLIDELLSSGGSEDQIRLATESNAERQRQAAQLTNQMSRLQTQKGMIRPSEFQGTLADMDRLTGRTGNATFRAKFIDLAEQELRDQIAPSIRQQAETMQEADPSGFDRLIKELSGSEVKPSNPDDVIELLMRQAIGVASLRVEERARQLAAEANWIWE